MNDNLVESCGRRRSVDYVCRIAYLRRESLEMSIDLRFLPFITLDRLKPASLFHIPESILRLPLVYRRVDELLMTVALRDPGYVRAISSSSRGRLRALNQLCYSLTAGPSVI